MKKNYAYVDGMILPVPSKNIAAYKKMATTMGKIWIEHGAINYTECMGDDVPAGKYTSFAKSVKLKKGEVVFFSWITYKTKADRNKVLKKVMSDPRVVKFMDSEVIPFDGERMFWGGFKPVVSL